MPQSNPGRATTSDDEEFLCAVAQLEKVQERESLAKAYSARIADGSRLVWVRRFLKALRTEQEGNESLAEATARAMGIGMSELKARLQEAAAGGSFWTREELEALKR